VAIPLVLLILMGLRSSTSKWPKLSGTNAESGAPLFMVMLRRMGSPSKKLYRSGITSMPVWHRANRGNAAIAKMKSMVVSWRKH
jgi:hypothetical protein